ncbi:MAG: tyrosine-protein phosphatase [Flavisolibacter sp.]
MLFFSNKKANPVDLSWLSTDMHSHLLPGIDDGAPDLSTSVEVVKGFQAMGYQKIVTTPHILWEIYPNTPEIISTKEKELSKALKDGGIDIKFKAAAEYFIDEHFVQQLKKKMPLLTIAENLVLVEFSMIASPVDWQEIFFEMQMQNYQPVLAHPERYTYLGRRTEVFDQLKDAGCWFQVNLLALSGYYGETVQQLSDYLLKKKYYDLAGTDLHHHKHLQQLQKLPASQLNRLRDSGLIKNHLL